MVGSMTPFTIGTDTSTAGIAWCEACQTWLTPEVVIDDYGRATYLYVHLDNVPHPADPRVLADNWWRT
jgi:hypothetical protein